VVIVWVTPYKVEVLHSNAESASGLTEQLVVDDLLVQGRWIRRPTVSLHVAQAADRIAEHARDRRPFRIPVLDQMAQLAFEFVRPTVIL
jgi:hypothetical protein